MRRGAADFEQVSAVYHPELYALVHRGTPGDERLYLEAARGAQRILELGCGYGRLLGPLAHAGHRVTGLELDRGLLELAHAAVAALPPPARERVHLVHGDMRDFALAERFDRVFIPFSGAYCLASEAELVACLQCVRAHLAPGGTLVFDAYVIDGFHAEADPDTDREQDDGEAVGTVAWRGDTYDVYEFTVWDRSSQRLDVTYRYQPRGAGSPLFGTIRHRYLLTGQVEGICARAGLRLIDAQRGLDGAALTPESDHMVCLAARA